MYKVYEEQICPQHMRLGKRFSKKIKTLVSANLFNIRNNMLGSHNEQHVDIITRCGAVLITAKLIFLTLTFQYNILYKLNPVSFHTV